MSMTLISDTLRPLSAKGDESLIMLVGLGRQDIANHLTNHEDVLGIEPKKVRMRTKQIFHWIYNYGVTEWSQMTNIAKPLRAKLETIFSLHRPEIIERQISVDGTRKYLICLLYTSPSPRDS